MPTTPTVLLALDKFKGSLTAREACTELRRGLLAGGQPVEVVILPVADGGDGTLDAALSTGFDVRPVAALGPLGEHRTARIGTRGDTALIELAEICGLALLPNADRWPMRASTVGVGVAMKAAIELGYRDLLVGVGGSASTDGGIGAATGLGAQVLDAAGRAVPPGGAGLRAAVTVDFGPMLALLEGVRVVVATDVTSPLTGENGAARVFGAQKGATAADLDVLDTGLEQWARLLHKMTGIDVRHMPGVGAAGGLPAPFMATGSAQIASGAQLVLDLTGASQAIESADVVVTGEGRWDAQTGTGKAPHAVLEAARRSGKPVIAVAGSFSADADVSGLSARYSLTDLARGDQDPLQDAGEMLREIGASIRARLASDLFAAPAED